MYVLKKNLSFFFGLTNINKLDFININKSELLK